MKIEPFYVSGMYSVPELRVYAGWTAHEESFAASQVFLNARRDIALLFSGECRIDPQTRTQLKARGHDFEGEESRCLVHLYEEQGDQFFEKLNGLFSGLLIDQKQRKIFLFNDRYGVERIYWHETEDTMYFASEAKALLRILPAVREFDEEGIAQFLTYGCTLNGRTLFRGIQLLPAASLWSFENGTCRKKTYFSPAACESQSTLSAETFEARFQETFSRTLPRYFETRAKIGISLTGGLDTRMIMAYRPDTRPDTDEKQICYTFSGQQGLTLDDQLAARVAKACGLEHRILRLGSDFFSDFASHVDRTVYATDGCLGVTGAHEIYLNKQARQLASTRLTGNFGSEVLRGVSTFKPIAVSHDFLNPEFGRFVNDSVTTLSHFKDHPVTFAAFREIPWKLFGSLAAGRSQLTFRTPYLDNELVALAYRMPEHLRRSSLPASRLVKANSAVLCEIPTDRGFADDNSGLRFWLRRFAAETTFKIDFYNSEGLPFGLSFLDSVFRRLSSGLGLLGLHKYLPYRHWFRNELAGYLNGALAVPHIQRLPFLNYDFLKRMAKDHICGRNNYVHEINAAVMLGTIERLLFRNLPRGVEDATICRNQMTQQTPGIR